MRDLFFYGKDGCQFIDLNHVTRGRRSDPNWVELTLLNGDEVTFKQEKAKEVIARLGIQFVGLFGMAPANIELDADAAANSQLDGSGE